MRFAKLFRCRHRRGIDCLLSLLTFTWCLLSFSFADPITQDRLANLETADRAAWNDYLNRSNSWKQAIEQAFKDEIKSHRIAEPELAPEGSDFRLPEKKPDSWYAQEQATALADVLISYQNPAGGWSKHVAVNLGTRKSGVHWSSQGSITKPRYISTFDNASTTNQLLLLAQVHSQTNRRGCKQAIERGLRFILDAQYPNGGWPQVYPLEGGYHDDITFNDDAMVHVLELLDHVRSKRNGFDFVDESLRIESTKAFELGIACILKSQQTSDGKLSVWCAQHDALTLKPSSARAMEPASLSGSESVGILKLLMTIEQPSPAVVDSIESGLVWFQEHKIQGIRRTKLDGKQVFVADPESQEIHWARFYVLRFSHHAPRRTPWEQPKELAQAAKAIDCSCAPLGTLFGLGELGQDRLAIRRS